LLLFERGMMTALKLLSVLTTAIKPNNLYSIHDWKWNKKTIYIIIAIKMDTNYHNVILILSHVSHCSILAFKNNHQLLEILLFV
jgi:hypothetical protein